MKKTLKGKLKKAMGILLSAALLCGAVTASPAVAEQVADTMTVASENEPDGTVTYIYGDVDGSGDLSVSDALLILKHVVHLADLSGDALIMELADADHNKTIAVGDALTVLRCVVRLAAPDYYTVTPEESEEPEATAMPEASVEPEASAEPTATPKTTVEPEVRETTEAAPTTTPEAAETETPAPSEAATVTETPAPSEAAETTVEPTETPVAESETPKETVTPEVTVTPEATKKPVETTAASETVKPTEAVVITDEPTVAPTATPATTPTATPEVTETPTAAPTVTETPTVTPVATETPAATATPSAEPTPTPHVHAYTYTVTKEATCATEGVMTYTCACGDTHTEAIPATGHNYTSTVTKEATCAADGVETFTCSVCGDTYVKSIAATGLHDYAAAVTQEATCGEAGVKTYTCSVCGDMYTEEIPATGLHDYVKTDEQEYVVDEAAYDEEIITQTPVWVCYGCDPETYFYTPEEVNAHRDSYDGSVYHTTIKYNVTSISSDGWTIGPLTTRETVHHDEVGHYEDVYKCSVCDAVKETETPDPATCEHNYVRTEKKTWVVDVEDHYESAKHSVHICQTCEEKFYTVESLSKHSFANNHGWSRTESYTCKDHYEEVGHYETEVTYVCSICGDVKDYVDSDTCEHEWYVEREAWNEYGEERHLYCLCGFYCGIAGDEAASEAWHNHIAQYDMTDDDTYYQHYRSKAYTITVAYPQAAIYRCELCGKYKESE